MQKPDLAAALFARTDAALATLPDTAKIYCVGGAVRDQLMGLPNGDRDYVVVGAHVDDMLHAGFRPVGKDFPVFLHPVSHDEYALARTERKSGKGYKGFVFLADPSVTLEDDLARRDLTINAIAIDRGGQLIDPFGGLRDLQAKVLRHVSAAFSEDPVRLLRLARFLARWPDFQVAPETQHLCEKIVNDGEANALVAERVWQEIQTGLMEAQPSRMFELLMKCGAWQAITRAGSRVPHNTLLQIDQAAQQQLPLEARFGLLVHHLEGEAIDLATLKPPKSCIEFAQLLERATQALPASFDRAQALLDWLVLTDFQRKPDRFVTLLKCMAIEGMLEPAGITLIQEAAALFDSTWASEKIAAAAKAAENQGSLAKSAVTAARLEVLKSDPRFS